MSGIINIGLLNLYPGEHPNSQDEDGECIGVIALSKPAYRDATEAAAEEWANKHDPMI